MQSLIHMAGGIALLLWGAYMVKTGMLRTFGVALKDFLSVRLKNRAIAMASATTLASLLQLSLIHISPIGILKIVTAR